MSESRKMAFQDNAITRARYKVSELPKNIFYYVMRMMNKDSRDQRYYRIPVREFYNTVGIDANYKEFKAATKSLVKYYIEVSRVDEQGREHFLQTNLFASAEYVVGTGTVEIELSDKIKPYLFELKDHFTVFDLDIALSLKSMYSKRIFELLNSAKNKKKKELTLTIEELRHMFCLEDKYLRWSQFKTRVLEIAHKEINEYADQSGLRYEYLPKKLGRSFHEVRFVIDYDSDKKKRLEVCKNTFLAGWQEEIIDSELTGKEKRSLLTQLQWAMQEYRDKGVENMAVFSSQFCAEFCTLHFKKSLPLYKGKRNFNIDFTVYKPTTK